MLRRPLLAIALIGLAACKGSGPRIEIQYDLHTLELAKIARIETIIRVDPKDGRQFFVDQPYRAVKTGIGYEVRDIDGDGVRELVLLHEASLGFVFASQFTFRLLPPATGDAPPLVISARAYGPSSTLGEAKQLAAVYQKSGMVVLTLESTLCGAVDCAAEQTCCADKCVTTSDDPANCGGCDTACGANSDACLGGVCRCNGGAACGASETCCAGAGCLNLGSDPFNCGACGHACNPGETCVSGECRCGDSVACGADVVCCIVGGKGVCSQTGSCACGGTTCNAPTVCCNEAQGLCANLPTDDNNCGGCGKTCSGGLHCQAGSCRCAGQICATGDACCADGCRTLADDPKNCGGCGHQCGAGEICSQGVCHCGAGAACDNGKKCCAGSCVNQKTDARNCGGCDIACQPGEDCKEAVCSCNGGLACATGFTCCGASGCVDLKSNPAHCNSCEIGCSPGQSCIGGMCLTTTCDPSCALNGNQCDNGKCYCEGSVDKGPCKGSLTCCPGAGCLDLTSDPNNCAKCGNPCGKFQACCNGVCQSATQLCNVVETCNGVICPDGSLCCPSCGSGGPVMTNSGGTGGTVYSCVPGVDVCPPIDICPL